jgi:hypothetical protein
MNWKVKVQIGEVSMELEIPMSERGMFDMTDNGTVGKSLAVIDMLNERALSTSLKFEESKSQKRQDQI